MRKILIFNKTKIILIGLVLLAFLFLPKLPVQAASNDILVYYTLLPSSYGIACSEAGIFTDDLSNLGYNITVKHRANKNELGLTAASIVNLLDYGQVWTIDLGMQSEPFEENEIFAIKTFRDSPHKGGLLLSVDHGPYYQSTVNPITKQFNNNTELFFSGVDPPDVPTKYCFSPSFTNHPLYFGLTALSSSNSDAKFIIKNLNIETTAKSGNSTYGAVLDEPGKGKIVFDSSTVRFLKYEDCGYAICSDEESKYQQNIAKWLSSLSPSCFITLSSSSITSGDSVTITWSSENADSVVDSINLDNTAELSDSITKSPTSKTAYQLRVVNSSGETADCETTVNVNQPAVQLPIEVSAPTPSQNTTVNLPNKSLSEILQDLIKWLLQIVILIAILMIIVSGIMYMISAGDQQKAETAKKALTYAILGLLVAGLAYAIVKTLVDVLS